MTRPAAHHRLQLATHVCACEVGGQVVLLDLRANRYMGIDGATATALATHVHGWPVIASTSPDREPERSSEHEGLAERLVLQGLLVVANVDERSRSFMPGPLEEATASLDLGDVAAHQGIGPRRLTDFLRSTAHAALWLRTRSLYSVASKLAARRQGQAERDPSLLPRMKQVAATYERMRPLLLTANEKCLFDSLALMGFLATENLYPRWVIGVKTRPFGAHSWVQAGTTVLNDQHEHVRKFRPILAV